MGLLDTIDQTLAKWTAKVRLDKPVAWRFEVEIEGIRDKGFLECKGLEKSLTVVNFNECNSMSQSMIPVSRDISVVTLKKAVSFDTKMEEWYNLIESHKRGDPDPRRFVVIRQLYGIPNGIPLIGGTTVELKSWTLPDASLLKLSGPDFDALNGKELSMLTAQIKSTGVTETADYGDIASLISAIQLFT